MRHILKRGAHLACWRGEMNTQWNSQESRFELEVDGQIAVATCTVRPKEWTVLHVIVPTSLRGGGVGSKLAQGVVEHARAENGKIVPVCPFMVAYFERHPEARDVLKEQ